MQQPSQQGFECEIFVFEPEGLSERSGCSMETHIETCPPELREYVQRGYVVPWLRMSQYQQASLLLILRRIYAAAPSKKREADFFFHKNDETRLPLHWRPPHEGPGAFHVYVSEHNTGAMEVFGQLQYECKKACRQQTLSITRDFNNVVAKKADHFLVLLSGTLFDDYESKDEAKKAAAETLFAELKIAIQNHVHIFLVHDCRGAFGSCSSTPPAHRRRISMQIENQLLTLAKEQGVTADVEAATSQGRRRGSVRNSTVVSFDHLATKEADDAGKPADEEQPATGRFAKFRDIISRTPADLRELKIYHELASPLYGKVPNDVHHITSVKLILRALLHKDVTRVAKELLQRAGEVAPSLKMGASKLSKWRRWCRWLEARKRTRSELLGGDELGRDEARGASSSIKMLGWRMGSCKVIDSSYARTDGMAAQKRIGADEPESGKDAMSSADTSAEETGAPAAIALHDGHLGQAAATGSQRAMERPSSANLAPRPASARLSASQKGDRGELQSASVD